MEAAQAISAPSAWMAASSRATRSDGRKGASQAMLATQRQSGALAAAQSSPVSTPARGPAWPSTTSATTGSPKAAKRAGSPLAFSTRVATWGRARSTMCCRIGRPPSGRRHLSPPPMRRDRPPARSTPATDPIPASGSVMVGPFRARRIRVRTLVLWSGAGPCKPGSPCGIVRRSGACAASAAARPHADPMPAPDAPDALRTPPGHPPEAFRVFPTVCSFFATNSVQDGDKKHRCCDCATVS